jgi:hypothetical protein
MATVGQRSSIFTCTHVEITLVRFTKRNFKQGAENVYDIKHGSEGFSCDSGRRPTKVVVENPDNNDAQHLGVVGDTYTILLSGMDTAGRFTLIDMHVPPEGGPPRIAMISRRPLFFSVNCKLLSEGRSVLCALLIGRLGFAGVALHGIGAR